MSASMSDPGRHRSRSILLAVLTSFVSKGGNILLMLLAIPLAYRVLGEERAAIYGVMQSLMWLVSMSDLGTGPGMVRRLAGAVAAGDRKEQGAIVSSAFLVSCGLAITGCALISLLLFTVPLTTIFGDAFAPYAVELKQTVWVSLGIFTVLMILASLERIREGYQEVHVGNGFGAVYNVSAALLLWLGIQYYPTPVFVVCAVYGLLVFFSVVNSASILWRRPWLLPSLRKIDRGLLLSMTREGLALFAAGSVAPILVREAPKFMLGRTGHPAAAAEVAHYWILIQLGLIGMGFVMMVTRPLLPAMADAACRRDYAWITAARAKMMKLFLPCAVAVVAGFALMGPWFTAWWLKTDGGLTRMQFTSYGLLFVLSAWSHLHYVMLGSIGMARMAARILLAEVVIILPLTWMCIQWNGLSGSIFAACAGMIAVSAWLMPLQLGRALRRTTAGAADSEPSLQPV